MKSTAIATCCKIYTRRLAAVNSTISVDRHRSSLFLTGGVSISPSEASPTVLVSMALGLWWGKLERAWERDERTGTLGYMGYILHGRLWPKDEPGVPFWWPGGTFCCLRSCSQVVQVQLTRIITVTLTAMLLDSCGVGGSQQHGGDNHMWLNCKFSFFVSTRFCC